jgi:hypothetical protein
MQSRTNKTICTPRLAGRQKGRWGIGSFEPVILQRRPRQASREALKTCREGERGRERKRERERERLKATETV